MPENAATQFPDFPVMTGTIPGSQKIYLACPENDTITVAMRQIALDPASARTPVILYDTSGPYTDPKARINIAAGLTPLRSNWITQRNDSASYPGRPLKPLDNGHRQAPGVPRFPDADSRHPRRAKNNQPVTQLAYARRGIITPEMEYVRNPGKTKAAAPGTTPPPMTPHSQTHHQAMNHATASRSVPGCRIS